MLPYDSYLSPFSWRYGSQAMRSIWSEIHKRRTWRRIWLELAHVQSDFGLVSPEQVAELELHVDQVDMQQALSIEARIHHDLMAELKTYAGQCPLAGGILHLGATSMDIEDNAEALRLRQSLQLVMENVGQLLNVFADLIEKYADLTVMAFTHMQAAEPTTLGYRFAMYAQDLLTDYQELSRLRKGLRGKGFTGAVGTAASYADLIGLENLPEFEHKLSQKLDLPFYEVSTQTYPRRQDYQVLSLIAGVAATLAKFALDFRFMQSPAIGEWGELFHANQVGSSAMPFKRNPILSEKIDSLARQLAVYPQIAWQNAANSILERTLDDSANRRTILPEAFLLIDEILISVLKLVSGMEIRKDAIAFNLVRYAPFACTERILMRAGKLGADRQEMHELLREYALVTWQEIQTGLPNRLVDKIKLDARLKVFLNSEEVDLLSDISGYTGWARDSALNMAAHIRAELASGHK